MLITDINGTIISGFNKGHGLVVITKLAGTPMHHQSSHLFLLSYLIVKLNQEGKELLLDELGSGYRFATAEELSRQMEAATSGSVNKWNSTRPIKPRNLPAK